ncbi:MAG TPA: NfeD family protein [Gemmatimonadales bacterium]
MRRPRAVFALLCAAGLALGMPTISAQQVVVVRVPVHGVIELGIAPFVARGIAEAAAMGAAAVVLDIETPGGRVDAAQRMVRAIAESDVPVYALVNTHAWSAGAMIALAADSIFMTPGSSIGAATPVSGAGEKAPEKIVSAMRGEFRALAERRGLDPRLAESMVDEEIAIDGVVEAGKLLTLTSREAVNLTVASGEVEGFAGLLERLNLSGAETVDVRLNWAEQVVRFLSHPMVSPLLLSIGMLGLIIEIKTPAFGLAGATGVLALGAFFGSHLIIGLAGWEEVILLAVGLIALLLEIFVVPGFGVAGAIAILCISAATFLALLGSLATWADIARAGGIFAAAAMIITATIYWFVRYLPTRHRLGGVFLQASTARNAGYISGDTREDLVGHEGVAITDLRPAGTVKIGEERLDVVSDVGFVAKGTKVKVIRAESYRHVVEPIE